jgi:hypothetical protein
VKRRKKGIGLPASPVKRKGEGVASSSVFFHFVKGWRDSVNGNLVLGPRFRKTTFVVLWVVFFLAAWVEIVSKNNPKDQFLVPFHPILHQLGTKGGSENQQK